MLWERGRAQHAKIPPLAGLTTVMRRDLRRALEGDVTAQGHIAVPCFCMLHRLVVLADQKKVVDIQTIRPLLIYSGERTFVFTSRDCR